jgi:multidrug efflux pump subunit AcrB/outer membrane protein TolC
MIRWLVRHAPSVVLLILCVVSFGALSYATLPREASPDVKIPVVLVTTPYIGVAPADIESLVTIPIENELAGVKDVKKMSSTSAEGVAIISLEFEPSVVIEDALQRVRDRVNRAKPKLPEDAEEPQVQEVSFSDVPIMIVTIAGDADLETLKNLAEKLEDEAGRIPGVLDTRVSGGLEREFRVDVDPRRIALYQIGLSDVVNAVSGENVNIPGGDVVTGDSNYLLRVPGELKTAEDIENIAIKKVGDRPVFVRDVARVVDGYAEVDSYARMNRGQAVSLSITKRAGASIIDIADEVRVLAEEHAEAWPAGVEYRVLSDQSKMIRQMVSDLENNIITALLLVMAVIIFFMGARNSIFVAFSIPMSMLMSFMVIQFFGLTLNMIVLFSLILALGMLVDNAIVIVENVYRHMEEGADIVTASIEGTSEVAVAVGASTATTVAAFAPLVFWTGIMGQFMGYLPKTVIIVLISSLVVAIAMLPVVTSRLLKRDAKASEAIAGEDAMGEGENTGIMGMYQRLLELSINHRYISAGLGVGSFVVTIFAYGILNHGTEFFPDTDPNRATIAVQLPDGSDLENTDRVVRQIEDVLAQIDNVDVFVAETGVSGGGSPLAGSQAQGNAARINVDFLPHANDAKEGERVRVESTSLTIDTIREAVRQIPGADIEVNKETMGPPVGAAIAVEVSGPDFHEVGRLAQQIKRKVAAIEGTTEVSDDYKVGRPEMRLRIDRGAAKRVGASTAQVANTVRTAVAGVIASAIRDGSEEYDVVVGLAPEHRESLQDILSLRIPGKGNGPETFQVPLSTVAGYELAGGEGSIRHIDQDLVVTISGDVAGGFNENAVRGDVIALIDQLKSEGELPAGFDLRLGGANDEQQEAGAFLGRAFLIAVFLIAIVLVTQFNNFRLPFIILFTVGLSLIGVLWGLVLTGTAFGIMMTGLGIISLAGVVVNNAIVLLDYVEQLRERGMETREALIKAGLTRFRPVMLTAITTVLGLVPMAIGVSFDFRSFKLLVGGSNSQFWGPMAIAVIFGLVFATLLTLVMVPTLYSIFEDLRRFTSRMRGQSPGGETGSMQPAKVLPWLVVPAALGAWASDAVAASVTLEQAYASAESENIDLQIAIERRKQTDTLRGQAWALVSPKLQLGGSWTLNQFEQEIDLTSQQAGLYDLLGASFGLTNPTAAFPDQATLESLGVDSATASQLADQNLAQLYSDIATDIRSVDPFVIQQKSFFAANASVIQPLFNGRSLPTLRGAYRTMDAGRLQEHRTRQQIRASVAQVYYGLLQAREAVALSKGAVESATNHKLLAERQINAGLADRRAMLQAELSLSQATRDLASAEQRLDSAEVAFAETTGLPRNTEVVLPDEPPAPPELDGAVAQAMESRADVQSAELQTDIATFTRRAKLAEWAPTFDARFTYNWSENTGFVGENGYWMFVVSADWLLWDGGLRLAQAREEASKQRQARLSAQKVRDVAEREVRNAWLEYRRAAEALSSTEREVALATENLRMAETAQVAGTATWLELEDARLGLIRAQLSNLAERSARDLAAIQLQLAVGTL